MFLPYFYIYVINSTKLNFDQKYYLPFQIILKQNSDLTLLSLKYVHTFLQSPYFIFEKEPYTKMPFSNLNKLFDLMIVKKFVSMEGGIFPHIIIMIILMIIYLVFLTMNKFLHIRHIPRIPF